MAALISDCFLRAAASARLCVETCLNKDLTPTVIAAASARLCVETEQGKYSKSELAQPPPRGCVLKLQNEYLDQPATHAAASARLSVETAHTFAYVGWQARAAASARLCVETLTH